MIGRQQHHERRRIAFGQHEGCDRSGRCRVASELFEYDCVWRNAASRIRSAIRKRCSWFQIMSGAANCEPDTRRAVS
jgi:hypothetical protein